MEEKDMIMNETCEETVQQPAWEVVPDLETVEEALEEVEEAVEEVLEDAEKELKRGIAAVKEWLHNTLYEANRLFKEHKIAGASLFLVDAIHPPNGEAFCQEVLQGYCNFLQLRV